MPRQQPDKVPVSLGAVLQRINRKLKDDGQKLKPARSVRMMQEVGAYYVLDTSSNGILHKGVNVEKFAREAGVLEPWEEVR